MSTTTSTRGGTNVECLAKGERNYACDRSVTLETDFRSASNALIMHAEQILITLEEEDREVDSFTIGKTFVRAARNHSVFNPRNPSSWRKDVCLKILTFIRS